MGNVLETITAIFKDFVDEDPKPHLHVGEVMALWTAYTAFHEAHMLYQVCLNSTGDKDLKHAITAAYHSSKQDTKKIEEFLKKEGVSMPSVSSPKPNSNPDSIPEGVRLTEKELVNLISVKIVTSISFCAQAASQSVRTDVGLLFFEIQVHLMEYMAQLKRLMKNRGWLNIPPSYIPPGIPES
ncbi:DUF3231 family protein [Neobacillus niacini]|uniref:DUF3231 family protein n=1 Tax=Neobacillus niacini TaxID=86668 RepID=UPI0021CB8F12|nr:DUF3231 family protein [Neobacillus niacini]MCM3763731.1 DUF3231 family protein [Neobacillus niacini]